MTISFRRLGRMLLLDKIGMFVGLAVLSLLALILLPLLYALLGIAALTAGALYLDRRLGKHLVTNQLPMRSVPQRLRKLVDAPVVVFGHTHDPRWQPLRSGGLYVNAGTWLPALRPGLRRSFTHVFIHPRENQKPLVELRQFKDGTSQPFNAAADLGAGVTAPGMHDAVDWTKVAG